jgi:hypothetical protein
MSGEHELRALNVRKLPTRSGWRNMIPGEGKLSGGSRMGPQGGQPTFFAQLLASTKEDALVNVHSRGYATETDSAPKQALSALPVRA